MSKSDYHDNFASAQAAAQGSLDRAAQPSLFDRFEWAMRLHNMCLPAQKPLIIHSEKQQKNAWMFLMKRGFGDYSALANWYNFTYRPIFDHSYDEVTKLSLLAQLATSLSKKCHRIEISPVPEEDDSASLTERAFRQAGWHVFKTQTDENHILEVNGRTFDEYWASRPGQLRSTVRRKAKKNIVSIRIESEFNEESWADYELIYAQSWKTAEGSPEFLRQLATSEASAGCLRLGLAYIDGVPAAAQFWTVENGTALIHKLAHDEKYIKSSPGSLLSAAMFQQAIDVDKVDLIDFGTGNDRYKHDWMEKVRPRYLLEMYWPNSPLSWFPIVKHHISKLVAKHRSH